MIKKLLSLSLFAGGLQALPTTALAQTQPPVKVVEIKFGKPELADFEAKNFVADSTAPAVVLYDFGNTRFRLNGTSFQLESERVTRIKIHRGATLPPRAE
jgi:hypothetical protein